MYSYETTVVIKTTDAVVYFVSVMDNNFSQHVTRRQLRPPWMAGLRQTARLLQRFRYDLRP